VLECSSFNGALKNVSTPILIYDGDCPMCLRAKAWIEARSPAGTIRFLPCQSDDREVLAPWLSLEACMEAMRFVAANETVYTGHAAFPPLLRSMGKYRWLACFLELPIVRHLAPLVYARIARHRYAISGLFKDPKAGESCSIDSGCK